MAMTARLLGTIDPAIGVLPVLDEGGRPRPLQDLWADGTAVVVFLRHFG